MKQVTSKYGRGLLPTYFKIIGIIVIALSFAVMYMLKYVLTPDQKPLAKIISINIGIIGLFLIAWSRDKIEDEMSVHLRFNAMALSFIFGVMFCIMHPIVNLVLGDTDYNLPGHQLVMTMLLFFIITYTIKKNSNK